MTIDRLINVLVTILLIDMMVVIGLETTIAELMVAVQNRRLLVQAVLANYLWFPLATVGLLHFFHPADSAVTAGFLILAVCPGAPFGPPCTRMAGGNVAAAVGVMVILCASSALAAPLLLRWLLPMLSGGETFSVDVVRIISTLVMTQILPLCLGLWLRHQRPAFAAILQKPANRLSAILSLGAVGLIVYAQFDLLMQIRLRAYTGMLCLLVASLAGGWILGWPREENRKAMALTTSLRNVGVALVIASGSFPNTAAVTTVLSYGIIEIFGALLLAWFWGRSATAPRSS